MSWETDCRSAETALAASQIPPLDRILSLIKRVNPTSLGLPDADRERGYQIKNDLQNLLLENYGEYFHLVPHPCTPDIVLIKHQMLPSIDACHCHQAAISAKALETVADAPTRLTEQVRKEKRGTRGKQICGSANETVKQAKQLLDAYEYEGAAGLLASIRIRKSADVPTLLRGVRLLTEEMGAYQLAIETLLSQPIEVIKDKQVRELLALAYFNNGMKPEARATLDSLGTGEQGMAALYARARIAIDDGSFFLAYRLLQVARKREGAASEPPELRQEIEHALRKEVDPDLERGRAALEREDFGDALQFAREALRSFPGCRQAREILAEIGSRDSRAQLAMLWDQFELAEGPEERLELLGRLLEHDRERREEIRTLMEAEKSTRKRSLAEERMSELRELAAHKAWRECFGIVRWFLGGAVRQQVIREICEIAPTFHLLCHSRKLQNLSDDEAAKLWLDFLEITESLHSGRTAGCPEKLEEMRPYFGGHQQFKETYRAILACEQAAARVKADDLICRIFDDGCTREEFETHADNLRRILTRSPQRSVTGIWFTWRSGRAGSGCPVSSSHFWTISAPPCSPEAAQEQEA